MNHLLILDCCRPVANTIEDIYKQNVEIQNSLKGLKEKSFFETILPLIYTVIGLAIGFLSQLFFFRSSAKKELKKDIRKLYADFAFYSREYGVEFGNFSEKFGCNGQKVG